MFSLEQVHGNGAIVLKVEPGTILRLADGMRLRRGTSGYQVTSNGDGKAVIFALAGVICTGPHPDANKAFIRVEYKQQVIDLDGTVSEIVPDHNRNVKVAPVRQFVRYGEDTTPAVMLFDYSDIGMPNQWKVSPHGPDRPDEDMDWYDSEEEAQGAANFYVAQMGGTS